MPELVWVLIFIAGLFAIEFFYIHTHQLTISEHLQRLNDAMPKQILAGIFFLLGAVVGWFIAHATDTVVR
jgi:hypothetical protein